MHTCSSFQGLVQIVIYSFTELSSTSKDWRILKLRHRHFVVSSSLVWEHWVHWHPPKCDGVNQSYDKWKKTKQFSQKDIFVSSENPDFENQKKGVVQKLITFIVKLRLTDIRIVTKTNPSTLFWWNGLYIKLSFISQYSFTWA